jgi:hypothetical protein
VGKLLRFGVGAYLLFAWLVTVNGCTPQKRLQRLVRKHPHLITTDTVRVIDTVRIDAVRIDTAWNVREFHHHLIDTIRIVRDNLRVEIWKHDSLIYLNAECADTTIIREVAMPYDTIKIEKRTGAPWWLFALVGGVAAALLLVFLISQSRSRNS